MDRAKLHKEIQRILQEEPCTFNESIELIIDKVTEAYKMELRHYYRN